MNHIIFSLPCEGSNSLQGSCSVSPTWSKSSQLGSWAGVTILMGCLSPQQPLNGPLWRRGPKPWPVSLGTASQLGDLVFATDVGVTISPGCSPWSAHHTLTAIEVPGSWLICSVLNVASGLKMLEGLGLQEALPSLPGSSRVCFRSVCTYPHCHQGASLTYKAQTLVPFSLGEGSSDPQPLALQGP